MKASRLMVATALAALSCVAAPCGVVSFSMKVAQTTEQPQKVITSDQMKSFHEEADKLVWRGHPLLGDAFTVTATRKQVADGTEWNVAYEGNESDWYVVNLLKDLQEDMDLTYIFISHDLSVVEHISDKVGVMYLGRMVEYADTEAIFKRPLHPYTEALLSAVPIPDPDMNRERIPLSGEIPNPADPPAGCPFHTRCPYSTEKCASVMPEFTEREKGHFVACHMTEAALKGILSD